MKYENKYVPVSIIIFCIEYHYNQIENHHCISDNINFYKSLFVTNDVTPIWCKRTYEKWKEDADLQILYNIEYCQEKMKKNIILKNKKQKYDNKRIPKTSYIR